MIKSTTRMVASYDVIILGGGLAGLCLARQLKLKVPDLRILVLEKNEFPVREAAFKVGESTVEIAGFYLREVLQLGSYLVNEQHRKCGLRYFFKDEKNDFASYPEIGLSDYPATDSYQLDRGKLENDLCFINKVSGIEMLDAITVQDIRFNKDTLHEVVCMGRDNADFVFKGRWVVDASGRRSIIQKKLNLKVQVDSKCSSVWFRVRRRIDVSDFVPADNIDWHQRVPFKKRFFSTTHLMGNGYWIWLIPLVNSNTSVGIVIDGKKQNYSDLNTLAKARQWISTEYPMLAERLEAAEVLDFLGLRNYSYSSQQVYSGDRWACTGEAAFFADPFYSPGSNLIGIGNSIITSLIADDSAGRMATDERLAFYNEYIISLNESLLFDTQRSYPYFGNAQVKSLSFIWDVFIGWAIMAPQMFNLVFLDEQKFRKVREVIHSFNALQLQVKQLFLDWSVRSQETFTFQFIDYLSIPFVKTIYSRMLTPGRSIDELTGDYQFAMQRIEEFVQVIFWLALEDCMPATLKDMPKPFWINVWAVNLDAGQWQKGGLFQPRSAPRNIADIERQVRMLYTFHADSENLNQKNENLPQHGKDGQQIV